MASPKNYERNKSLEKSDDVVAYAWKSTVTDTEVYVRKAPRTARRRGKAKWEVVAVHLERKPHHTIGATMNKEKGRKMAVDWMEDHPRS